MKTDWREVLLGKVAEIAAGQGAPQGDHFYGEHGYPFVRAGSLDSLTKGMPESSLEHIEEPVAIKYRLRLFPKNTILFAKSGMSATKGLVYRLKKPCYVVSHLAAVMPSINLDPSFLVHWLLSHSPARLIRDPAYPSVRLSDIGEIRVPLPPLLEQRRIAAILDKTNAIRRKRQEAILLTDEFIRSVFLDMFGDPVTNPKGWPLGSLGEVIHTAKDGPHVSPKYSTTGIPFLSTRHIKCGNIVWEDLKFISLDEAKRQWKKCKPEKGDILYTKGGTTGIATVYDSDREIAVWVHIAILKTNHQKVDPIWLENMLNSKYCYTQSQRYTHGITNQDLGLTRMVKIKMYIPPYKLQREFASGIKKIKQNLSKQQDALFLYDNFFNSLIQRAFRGELKPTEAELVKNRENRGGTFFTC